MPIIAIIVASAVGFGALVGYRHPEVTKLALQSPTVGGAVFHPNFDVELSDTVKVPSSTPKEIIQAVDMPSVWK